MCHPGHEVLAGPLKVRANARSRASCTALNRAPNNGIN
jgi:hypothetical protein